MKEKNENSVEMIRRKARMNEDYKISDILIMLNDRKSLLEYKADVFGEFNADTEKMTGTDHRRRVGMAVSTTRKVITRGGTDDEVERCLVYLLICIDAKKKGYDIQKAYDGLGIRDILNKYVDKKKDKEKTEE